MGIQRIFSFIPKNSICLACTIFFTAIISFIIYNTFEIYIKKRMYTISTPVSIKHMGKKIKLILLIDSGNLAIERATGRRIIFIKEKFPKEAFKNNFFAIPIKSTTGMKIKYGFIPEKIHFEDKKYNGEKYIVVPDTEGCEFGGYDGIIGVV